MSEKDNLQQILDIVKEQDLNTKELRVAPEEFKFGLVTQKPPLDLVQVNSTTEDLQDDYITVRENLYNIIEKGTQALDSMIDIANQSEKPFAFDCVSGLIKTLVQTNKELIELQKDMALMKQLKKDEKKPETGTTNINNAVFVGTAQQLNELIKSKKEVESS